MHKNKGSRLTIRAIDTDTKNVKSQAPDKAPSKDGSSINKLLGIKGAAQESNKWKIRLQLTKPVTWPPLVWGAAAFGYHSNMGAATRRSWLGKPIRRMGRWAGQALFGTLTSDIIFLTLLYSIAGLGIAMVNDFKSVEGDRALGLQVNAVTLFLSITSLPVAFCTETAKWICVGAIDITQLSVADVKKSVAAISNAWKIVNVEHPVRPSDLVSHGYINEDCTQNPHFFFFFSL
ncbi:hypothetical protein HN873_035118, partial [Arachis hypogaea]